MSEPGSKPFHGGLVASFDKGFASRAQEGDLFWCVRPGVLNRV